MAQTKKQVVFSPSKMTLETLTLGHDQPSVPLDHTTCTEWCRLWSSFGFSEQQWSSRAAKVDEYTRKLLDDTLLTYKEQLIKRRKLLQDSLEDYEELLERTGLSSTIETLFFDSLKLKDQEAYLDRQMQELLVNEGQLIHRRKEHESEQSQLCTLLNAAPVEIDPNLSLSLVQITEKLQDHIRMLHELRDLRLSQVQSYHSTLKEYAEQLEWTPASSSSPTIVRLLHEQFDRCLTADCLNEIECTLHELEHRVEAQKARFWSLHHQLGHLYERLGKDSEKDSCSAYRRGRENINAFVIKQLEDEIEDCREARMKNGKEYCQSIHQQIVDLLDKCRLGDEERVAVNRLPSEPLTPELLDVYDAEYDRILQLYEKRRPVLDAFNKWFSYWNDFVAFMKASTDPGRFHIRGYNAEVEGRKRKKFQRELPLIEQEFLHVLSENDHSVFLIDHQPIREKFDELHRQLPSSAKPMNTPAKTPAATRLLGLTPVRSRTPAKTPRRAVDNKEPFVLGTAVTSAARRAPKTPAAPVGRKLISKLTSRTEHQPARTKPRPAPLLHSSPAQAAAALPVHPPAGTGDQSLDFSLLHTMKNIHGQIKVMTSTPNSSFIPSDNRHGAYDKTAHNTIGRRKSKRRSKRTPVPLLRVQDTNDETVVCL